MNKTSSKRNQNKRKQKRKNGKNSATSVAGPSVVSTVLHRIPIFPAKAFRSGLLYYEQDFKSTHATGAKQDYFFFANSLFDPNATGTGHQPIGFDQMMLFYEHYVVTRARILVEFLNDDNPAKVGVYLSPDAVASTDVSKAVENGLMKVRVIDSDVAGGGTGQRMTRMELDVDIRKYLGRRSEQDLLDDSELRGGATSSPTEGVYFGVTTWGFPVGIQMTVWFAVTIAFDAWFFEPRKLASS